MRTTIDIDAPILGELKELRKKQRKSLGRLASDLLAEALHARKDRLVVREQKLEWITKPMSAKVDVSDTSAVHDLMDGAGS